MPRIARKYLESSFCHVIIQGINREYIFKQNELKEAYKHLLKKYSQEMKINILAYCIMDNHAHMLINAEKIEDMIKLMRKTNTSYGMLYNKLNSRVGYVFRDRYYTQAIKSEEQLFNCLVYIHNNPVQAEIVESPKEYKYSSYNEYLGKTNLISKDCIKLVFGSERKYQEEFFAIHKKKDITDVKDIIENESSNQIIDRYIKMYGKSIGDIINNEELFHKLLLDLRFKGGKSLREMSKILGINKDRLNKVINKRL